MDFIVFPLMAVAVKVMLGKLWVLPLPIHHTTSHGALSFHLQEFRLTRTCTHYQENLNKSLDSNTDLSYIFHL